MSPPTATPTHASPRSPLDSVLHGSTDFVLLHRPAVTGDDVVEILVGSSVSAERLSDVPLPDHAGPGTFVVIPYRQIDDRGFSVTDDGAPLLAITVTGCAEMARGPLMDLLPEATTGIRHGGFDTDDETYSSMVRSVLDQEIGCGTGANFVLKRSFTAEIPDFDVDAALALYGRLLRAERGAHWTFLARVDGHTFLGASPERHVSLAGGTAVMNPISGTYRYGSSGPSLDGVMEFLSDPKEIDELYMVVDEELKMMARFCDGGLRVVGPYLREMHRLAHTEYFIEGRTSADVRRVLHETLLAPTVTGSPLQSACRVITEYEQQGRGYYSGIAALIGRDERGPTMDSAILIRTAEIDDGGRFELGVGATLVRHSDAASEVDETHAKAAGMLAALADDDRERLRAHPEVRRALADRNAGISEFWLDGGSGGEPDPSIAGRRVVVVDAEDMFTAMLAHQLRALGMDVSVARFDEPYDAEGADLVVLGPGPGDPTAGDDPRVAHLGREVDRMITQRRPFLAICLSHQVLAYRLGLDVAPRSSPNQGLQRTVDLFGSTETVAFYNSFAASSDDDVLEHPVAGTIRVSRAPGGEVHALRGRHFASMQFHPESLLTCDGPRLLESAARGVMAS